MKKFMVTLPLIVFVFGCRTAESVGVENVKSTTIDVVPLPKDNHPEPEAGIFDDGGTLTKADNTEKVETRSVALEKSSSVADNIVGHSAEKVEKFQELSHPYRYISGVYCGAGVGVSLASCAVSAVQNPGNINIPTFKDSANQLAISICSGFGTNVYRRIYLGIELEILKKMSKKIKDNENLAIKFRPLLGFSMDIRMGYQFPEQGLMLFLTAGFCRICEQMAIVANGVSPNDNNNRWYTFGSFYPTVGCGAEYKLDHDWSARIDFRIAITSKDDSRKDIGIDALRYNLVGKPNNTTLKFSLTRNIY
ncbi:MAG: porin family protein [Holosporaceae bacterium]|jgi:hypothetical protein|nr:porin family protein [Holosporaceae bacterium]